VRSQFDASVLLHVLMFWRGEHCPVGPSSERSTRLWRQVVAPGPDECAPEDERTELEPLVKNGTLTWRFWFTHGSTEEPTFERWNIQGVPNVIVLDHQGVIRARYLGTPGLETLEKTILELTKISEKESESKS